MIKSSMDLGTHTFDEGTRLWEYVVVEEEEEKEKEGECTWPGIYAEGAV